MESSSPAEFQRLILKIRLPLIWMGGAVLVWGIYKTYPSTGKNSRCTLFFSVIQRALHMQMI
jgi:uncharacterized membrane protein